MTAVAAHQPGFTDQTGSQPTISHGDSAPQGKSQIYFSNQLPTPNILCEVKGFVEDNPGELAKLVKSFCDLVGQILANAGKFSESAEARNVRNGFSLVGRSLDLIGTPLCAIGSAVAFVNAGAAAVKGEFMKFWKEFLEGGQELCNTAYCANGAVEIIADGRLSLVAQKVLSLVSTFGGLLGPIFGLGKNAVQMTMLVQGNKETALEADYPGDVAVKHSYQKMRASERNSIIFGMIRNIVNLTMSVIAVLAIIGGIAMAPSAAVIVFSVLTISGVIFKVASHISKKEKSAAENEGYVAVKQADAKKAVLEGSEVGSTSTRSDSPSCEGAQDHAPRGGGAPEGGARTPAHSDVSDDHSVSPSASGLQPGGESGRVVADAVTAPGE
jgi:uncharacterized protein (DUF697 family)